SNGGIERHDRQSTCECFGRLRRSHHAQSHINAEHAGALPDEFGICDEIEGWQSELDAPSPQLNRQVGPNAGRLAQCQSQGKCKGLAHCLILYSIIACLRTSSRYFLDSDSKRLAKICSRVSRLSGDSFVLSFLPQTANICSPWAVTSGAVKRPTGILPSTSRSCGVKSAEFRVTGSRTATSRKVRARARPSLQEANLPRRFSPSLRLAATTPSLEPRATTIITG